LPLFASTLLFLVLEDSFISDNCCSAATISQVLSFCPLFTFDNPRSATQGCSEFGAFLGFFGIVYLIIFDITRFTLLIFGFQIICEKYKLILDFKISEFFINYFNKIFYAQIL
jgi:hypothetical protein